MENLRVYEAARKLNLETSELMARLAARGVTVTGPIDTIGQEDFDAIADELKKNDAPVEEGAREEKPTPAPVLRLAPREESKSEAPPEPTPAEPGAKASTAEHPPSHHERVHHLSSAPHHHPKPSKGATVLSYVATGIAALALLLAVGIYTSVQEHTTGIATLTDQATAADAAIKDAALNADTSLAMSINNTNRIAQVDQRITTTEQGRIAGDLTRHAAALEELGSTLPAAQGERVADLARRLELLARSL